MRAIEAEQKTRQAEQEIMRLKVSQIVAVLRDMTSLLHMDLRDAAVQRIQKLDPMDPTLKEKST